MQNLEQEIAPKSELENIISWDEKTAEKIITSFTHLATELKEELPYYDAIISDDTSARLVSLFFREIINSKKEENNKEHVQTYFLTPKRGKYKEIDKNIHKFLTEKSPNIQKALIVTEHIDSGSSLKAIISGLEKNEIEYDIATISINKFLPLKKGLFEKVTYFSKGSDGLLFYKKGLEGVQTDRREKSTIHPKRVRDPEIKKIGIQARKDILYISNIVLQKLKEKE